MNRYQILIEYVGTNYNGWQVQRKGKTIQGRIWKEGFESGNICGQLYDDAINFVLSCTNDKCAIYSSGSVMVSELYIVK